MEQVKALNALAPFLALTKSASSPNAAVDLITRATTQPNTFVFAELLLSPQIQSLASAPAPQSTYLTLLQIFSYGTYADYHKAPASSLPPLNDGQTLKLRQLSLLTLAKSPEQLTYASLLENLGLQTARELEDLVISCIYAGLVEGTLDPYNQVVLLSSVSPLRDVPPNSTTAMLATLSAWSSRCTSTLSSIEHQIASIRSEALRRHREEAEWAAHVEKLLEPNAAKAREKALPKEEPDTARSLLGVSVGSGQKGKSVKRMKEEEEDEDEGVQDIDDEMDGGIEEPEVSKREGLRSGKRRGGAGGGGPLR